MSTTDLQTPIVNHQSKIYNLFLLLFFLVACTHHDESPFEGMDREPVVTRHTVRITEPDTREALSVGNGEFAFTVDVTGLQTFYEAHEEGLPLGTQSQWAWHSFPSGTADGTGERSAKWSGANPHRLHLGLIGLVLLKKNGEEVELADLQHIDHSLDPWTGKIESHYEIEGEPVHVTLYAHQEHDGIAVKITSPLANDDRLKVFFKFPYGAACASCPGYDFNYPDDKHSSEIISQSGERVILERKLDTTSYFVHIRHTDSEFTPTNKLHVFHLIPDDNTFSFTVFFEKWKDPVDIGYAAAEENSRQQWKRFWQHGGVIDFSACTDPRAAELERRVVLSQYLTKIQCAGSLPPQETGLTTNTAFGKFRTGPFLWHGTNLALWNRITLLEPYMSWYERIMKNALEAAEKKKQPGVKWPVLTGPYGTDVAAQEESASLWQQPHFIYLAELFNRQNPSYYALRYRQLVFETARFMASSAQRNALDKKYHFPQEASHGAFGLAYWQYTLSVAQQWRQRAELPPVKQWLEVLDNLALDHATAGAYGLIPLPNSLDSARETRTLETLIKGPLTETFTGLDYALLAMAAARLGEPDRAIDLLLMEAPKNTYLKSGHNYQHAKLPLYLPGNSALLTATAMMAAGWDGATGKNPGFPQNGTWNIVWENLHTLP